MAVVRFRWIFDVGGRNGSFASATEGFGGETEAFAHEALGPIVRAVEHAAVAGRSAAGFPALIGSAAHAPGG
jgi:hypothetical protein